MFGENLRVVQLTCWPRKIAWAVIVAVGIAELVMGGEVPRELLGCLFLLYVPISFLSERWQRRYWDLMESASGKEVIKREILGK